MHDAESLTIFIDNDRDLYRQQLPIMKNLMTKRASGQYDPRRAVDAFMYLAESGAKKFASEEDPGVPWHVQFPVAVRRQAAEILARSFEAEADLGNYDQLLPEKYRAAATPPRAGEASPGKKTRAELERDVAAFLGASPEKTRAPRKRSRA